MESHSSSLQVKVYFTGGGAAGSLNVTKPGRHLGCHLGFHQDLQIRFIQATLISKCVKFNGTETNRGIPRNLFRYPTDERLQQFASRRATIV